MLSKKLVLQIWQNRPSIGQPIAYFCMAILLSGCGQKGALYLPDDTGNNSDRQTQNVSNITEMNDKTIQTDKNSQLEDKDNY